MEIKLKGNYETRKVWLNDKLLSVNRSQKVWNHSPDGFAWGYGGSGASQLALAILLQLYPKNIALHNYQAFKWKEIATLPESDFEITINIDIE